MPNQDKNNAYLGKKIGEIATAAEFYRFTYEHIIQKIRSVDVIWFNVRKMPAMLFEVEHSADIKNSLSKFAELQDFYTDLHIVAADVRKKNLKQNYLQKFLGLFTIELNFLAMIMFPVGMQK